MSKLSVSLFCIARSILFVWSNEKLPCEWAILDNGIFEVFKECGVLIRLVWKNIWKNTLETRKRK